MAANCKILAGLVLVVFLSSMVRFSTCHVLKGSVTCLDCDAHSDDLSGIKVVVKCTQVNQLAMATTQEHGAFETQVPSENCLAMIMGAPRQLYVSRKNRVSAIVKVQESGSYIISQPLSFYTSCPSSQNQDGKCGAAGKSAGESFGSSKTVDLPLPREWGLAPSSYYVPFVPIIGIP